MFIIKLFIDTSTDRNKNYTLKFSHIRNGTLSHDLS